MADENIENNETTANGADERQISVLVQYVKDLSFESPSAPKSLEPSNARPDINVSVDVMANKMEQENNYEVTLKISASAKDGDDTIFIAEVSYAGVFLLGNIPENELQPALLIFCPSLLFPYVRRIISDVTRDGGFPSLMLDPIDFAKLYMERVKQAQQAKADEEKEA